MMMKPNGEEPLPGFLLRNAVEKKANKCQYFFVYFTCFTFSIFAVV